MEDENRETVEETVGKCIVGSYEIRGQSSCPINADRRVPVRPLGKACFFSAKAEFNVAIMQNGLYWQSLNPNSQG